MTLRPDTTGRPNAADLHEGHERREAGVGKPSLLIFQVEVSEEKPEIVYIPSREAEPPHLPGRGLWPRGGPRAHPPPWRPG